MFRMFPLLFILVALYTFLALGHGFASHDAMESFLSGSAVKIHMFSGEDWIFTLGDFFILAGLVLLFIEIIKATRTTSHEIINHGLSMLTFVLALVEFITMKGFSTSPFFFIMVMALFDVVAGYSISIVAAEHDLGLGRAGTD
jgi:hypothetical protein